MTCQETHEYLYAFLDSELDAPLSIELQRHLERCPDCAQQAEIERAIRRQLGASLESQVVGCLTDEHSLRYMIDHVTGPQRSFRPFSRRRYLLSGVAAAMIITVGVWSASRAWRASKPGQAFADLLVKDFEHFQQEGRPLQIASADRGVISDWLRDKTALAVVLPIADSTHAKLLGGRKCSLEGRPAAFALYEINGVPVSLVVVSADVAQLDLKSPAPGAEKSHFVDRCKGHTVVACTRGSLVYAAVSTLPAEDLLPLMPETAPQAPDGGHGTEIETR
jgi:anti-sigma factor RsiW